MNFLKIPVSITEKMDVITAIIVFFSFKKTLKKFCETMKMISTLQWKQERGTAGTMGRNSR